MTRARLGYDFLALPRKRHAGWIGLKHSSGQFLFAPLFEIAEGAPIPIHGPDWRVWLCRIWCLSGKARSPVCKALDELAERGVIALGEGSLSVLFRPEDRHNSSTQKPRDATTRAHSGSETAQLIPNSGSHLDLSVENNSTPKIQTDRQKRQTEEREREPAGFRQPLGEPPPGFVDRDETEPTLEQRIISAWRRGVSDKGGGQPAETQRARDGAKQVADWLRDNVRDNETPLSAFQAALKLYLADEKDSLRRASWPLGWLVERLPGYRMGKLPEQQTVTSPTHREWVPPDYERDMREANAAAEQRQREWFEQNPECRATVEEYDRKWDEQLAADRAARVVVPIGEAKPQVRGYRQKTPEELEERKRFLADQVRQLKAATAAE